MRAVVLQAARAAASADDEVRAHADGRDDRDRADDDAGLLAAVTGRRGLARHAVAGLAVGRLLTVRLLRRDTRLALLRVAVPGLAGLAGLLGVAVAGLRSLRLLAVRSLLAVRPGLLGLLPAVRARLVLTHDWVPLQMFTRC
ncbi:hypothetical protein SHKM778_79180 [Streptomyces sp. KM77-8]|uniref:Uncharacterized protein n=1 Tax=Streptomyces haneummycinicus TaxID=3074435 RepID=A0AAT9HVB7_9ACTN